ncbi:MAG TPA: dienelactone hydrolase family protein, partial [Anaerolineales bacterium]
MNTFQHYLAEEFVEDYQEGRISRREAVKYIASITGSLILAEGFLAACAPLATETPPAASASPTGMAEATETAPTGADPTPEDPAETPTQVESGTVSPDNPKVIAEPVTFPGQGADLSAYLAYPADDGQYPVVLVCHENRGLTDHIRDVARRLALAGYVALAVDLLSRQGGTDAVGSSNVPGALGNIQPEQFVQDFQSGFQYVQTLPFADASRVGMVGFCFGGGVTWLVATRMPELLAA